MDRSLRKLRYGAGLAGLVLTLWPASPQPANAAERVLCLEHPRAGVLRTWPNIKEGCYGVVLHNRLAYRRNIFDKMACKDSKSRRAERWRAFKARFPKRCTCASALRLVEVGVRTKKSKGFSGFIKDLTRDTEFLNIEIRSVTNQNRVYQMGAGLEPDFFVPASRANKSLTRFRVRLPGGEPPASLDALKRGDEIKLEQVGKSGSSYVNFADDPLIVAVPPESCR